MLKKIIALMLLAVVMETFDSDLVCAEPKGFNYEEAKVPQFDLPDPLIMNDGSEVKSPKQWREERRPEVFRLFQEQMYGIAPSKPEGVKFYVYDEDRKALDGKAIRKQVRIIIPNQTAKKGKPVVAELLVYLPTKTRRPLPTFLALNFRGNHTIHDDPNITVSKSWMPNDNRVGYTDNRATEASRGCSQNSLGG